MKGLCDSCTQEEEIAPYRLEAVTFYWCAECRDEEAICACVECEGEGESESAGNFKIYITN